MFSLFFLLSTHYYVLRIYFSTFIYPVSLFFTFYFQAHVLNHQAGLANAALEEISRDPFTVCDTDLILQLIEESSPEHSPGELTKYHYLTFGWIVEGIVRGVTGESLRDFVSKNIGDKLDISDEFMIGIPSQDQSQSVSQDQGQGQSVSQSVSVEGGSENAVGVTGEIATGSGSVNSVSNINIGVDVSSRVADLVLGKIIMPSPPTPPAPVVATSATTASATTTASTTANDSVSDSTSTATDTATTTASSTAPSATTSATTSATATQPIECKNDDQIISPDSTTPSTAAAVTETGTGTEMATEEIRVQSFKKRPPSGPSMLMNPTFFNNPRIRY